MGLVRVHLQRGVREVGRERQGGEGRRFCGAAGSDAAERCVLFAGSALDSAPNIEHSLATLSAA